MTDPDFAAHLATFDDRWTMRRQGFHVMLDALGMLLAGDVGGEENVLDWLARSDGDVTAVVEHRVSAYREHIRTHCPPA